MDRVWLSTGIHAVPSSSSSSISLDVRANQSTQVCAVGSRRQSSSSSADKSAAVVGSPPQRTSSKFSFMHPLTSLWPARARRPAVDAVLLDNNENPRSLASSSTNDDDDVQDDEKGSDANNGNWVMNILHVRSLWRDDAVIHNSHPVQPDSLDAKFISEEKDEYELVDKQENNNNNDDDDDDDNDGECDVCSLEEVQFDKDSFSHLLKRVSLADAKLYAKMSYLGNLAYSIPNIKPGNLLKKHGLRLVTSSIEKKELAAKVEKEKKSAEAPDEAGGIPEVAAEENNQKNAEKDPKDVHNRISAYAAYQIAASAASYLHSQTASILPLKSKKHGVIRGKPEETSADQNNVDKINSDVASLMATTDSVTSVVAAKEEVKQAVADDLNSTTSSPCEWFICDDDQSGTMFFVIQGSETLASWKANLLFEPIQFEGMDVLVHRGIYEAAKGIYEQMLPEIRTHMNSFGNRARFRFTGHSLGGSLAALVNLMLLIRGELPLSSLLPVITFGSPSIMCGGDKLLRKLGLPTTHIQSVMMHRDIVPRAFSCNYPNHVAELLKAVNGNFRNHPCLNNQKLLYAPMGELLILQPDEKFSPHHDLLPTGSGLYLLSCPASDAINEEKLLQAARMVFLNSPHPLEILSDRSAYGSGGTIQRDHDMNSYLKCVRGVIREELNHMRKARREHRRKIWWPLSASRDVSIGIVGGRPTISINGGQEPFKFSGFIRTGKESVKRFSRLVASQHMHLFVVFLFPARMLLLDAYSLITFQ